MMEDVDGPGVVRVEADEDVDGFWCVVCRGHGKAWGDNEAVDSELPVVPCCRPELGHRGRLHVLAESSGQHVQVYRLAHE